MSEPVLVSLGIPTFNGQTYIGRTLDSLLSQDHQNLEIIISDDASTDQTPEICAKYAAQDNRIRFYQNRERLGIFPNFNNAFQLSKGEYFMWVGQHDLMDRNFISACLGEFQKNPEIVLCSGQFSHMDENGNPVGKAQAKLDTLGMNAAQRFRSIFREPLACFAVYSLIRSSTLRKTRLFQDSFFSDLVFFREIGLHGDFFSTPKSTFYFRVFQQRDAMEGENEFDRVNRLMTARRANSLQGRIMARFPFWQHAILNLRLLFRAPLPVFRKLTLIPLVLSEWKGNLVRELTTRWIPRKTRKFMKRLIPGESGSRQ